MTSAPETISRPGAVAGFLREGSACWRQLPDKGFFFILLAAWVALFQFLGNSTLGYTKTSSLFGWMNFVYSTAPDESLGQLVPWVVLGLFWWKRKILLATPKNVWWPALGLVVLALFLHVIGYVIQQTRVSIAAFFLGLYGLTGLVWGRHWLRASFFPFFLFVFCLPVTAVSEPVTVPLRFTVAKITVALAQVLGIDVIRDGTQLFNARQTYAYDIAPACSGIRSLISLLALTTVYGFMVYRTAWRRLLMIGLAIPLAVLGNVLRITFVIVTAEAFGQEAGGWVEQKFGFVTFAVAIGCIALVGHWLHEPATEPVPNPKHPGS
jgi:exosortase